jgi:TPP-dependent pyruvate/acetoin dehydrogenase alpha subunit
MALAEKRRGSGKVVAVFIGDGTLGEGVVYESLNIATLWQLPILFVVENNRYAQTTPIEMHLAGSIGSRFHAFDVGFTEIETTDVVEIRGAAERSIYEVRAQSRSQALVLHTYRLAPHSKGDDFRDPAEIERFRQKDPISVLRGRICESEWQEALQSASGEVDDAFRQSESDPWPVAS